MNTSTILEAMSKHAEDLALCAGALLTALGVGLAYGLAFGLIAAGVLLVAYGIWIGRG